MLPDGFVYLDERVPGIGWDAKYFGHDNFMGRPADGYLVNRIVCTCPLADRIARVHEKVQKMGMNLFVFDAYRPARAVRDFVRWVNAPAGDERKAVHFPNIDRHDMLTLGYIAEKSGHSRGSSIDLTLTRNGEFLDMGGIFDLMDERSHTMSDAVSDRQRNNRLLLREIMLSSGFTDYSAEWWHFRLADEPHPDTYFDFPIE